jgi:hypothetical protein
MAIQKAVEIKYACSKIISYDEAGNRRRNLRG